jgi:hypothetical protein
MVAVAAKDRHRNFRASPIVGLEFSLLAAFDSPDNVRDNVVDQVDPS